MDRPLQTDGPWGAQARGVGPLRQTIGEGFCRNAQDLELLLPYADDAAFRQKFEAVKRLNKERLGRLIERQSRRAA